MKYLIITLFAIFALFNGAVNAQSDPECFLCDTVVNYIEKFAKENSSISYVTQEVEKVCIIAGPKYSATCKTLVESYLGEIIQMLENYETPKAICSQLGFCSSNAAKEETVQGGVKCTICDFLLKYVEQYVAEKKTEQQIMGLLDKACGKLHGIKSICTDVVNQYAPSIIKLLENSENPSTVCSQVGLC